ncbi:hypothetical protein IFM89_033806 [Coptis chinensis]|uniref:CCAAT-binding factor domain-containing protein n=1 Tax=Coptis chinensis TaxID=261450 RepID=A0A835HQJ9_9MAGN|nr:hypothetical protein IFM89_033806 [Coptis chinensis]
MPLVAKVIVNVSNLKQELEDELIVKEEENMVLVTLHQIVIPHLSSPIMLCDFLTRSYDVGGVTSVMALSSLYILMSQHGLEYPNFYEKLYALLEPSIFMAKHRANVFEWEEWFPFMEKICSVFSLCEGDCRVEKFRNQNGNTL